MKNWGIFVFITILVSLPASAQDPVQVDPQHYKIVYEDATLRVLRLTYGPGEKSVMHQHPFGGCVIFVTEFHGKSTDPNGEVTVEDHKPGEVACDSYRPGVFRHLPENIGDTSFEVILIERKPPAGTRQAGFRLESAFASGVESPQSKAQE
jgi:beta-alanine degradation protein BauB